MSEPVEGTLTAGEVTTVEIAGPVYEVVVTAAGADVWVSTDGRTPFVGNRNSAHHVPDGDTRTIDVPPGPAEADDPAIIKLISAGAASYIVAAGPQGPFQMHDLHDHAGIPGVGGDSGLPVPEEGDAGKSVVVNEAEDGFELAQSGASVAAPTPLTIALYVQGATPRGTLDFPAAFEADTPRGITVNFGPRIFAALDWVGGVEVSYPETVPAFTLADEQALELVYELFVSNAAGTESWYGKATYATGILGDPTDDIVADDPFPFPADDATWVNVAVVGTDLALDGSGNVQTTAGGVFFATLLVRLNSHFNDD